MDVLAYILAKKAAQEVPEELIDRKLREFKEKLDIILEAKFHQEEELISDLSRIDENISRGYFYAGVFWKEAAHINRLPDSIYKLYVDIETNSLYFYNQSEGKYEVLIPNADIELNTAGLVKLYTSTGNNEDGTMTQKSITENLNKKVEIDTSSVLQDECIEFITHNNS